MGLNKDSAAKYKLINNKKLDMGSKPNKKHKNKFKRNNHNSSLVISNEKCEKSTEPKSKEFKKHVEVFDVLKIYHEKKNAIIKLKFAKGKYTKYIPDDNLELILEFFGDHFNYLRLAFKYEYMLSKIYDSNHLTKFVKQNINHLCIPNKVIHSNFIIPQSMEKCISGNLFPDLPNIMKDKVKRLDGTGEDIYLLKKSKDISGFTKSKIISVICKQLFKIPSKRDFCPNSFYVKLKNDFPLLLIQNFFETFFEAEKFLKNKENKERSDMFCEDIFSHKMKETQISFMRLLNNLKKVEKWYEISGKNTLQYKKNMSCCTSISRKTIYQRKENEFTYSLKGVCHGCYKICKQCDFDPVYKLNKELTELHH